MRALSYVSFAAAVFYSLPSLGTETPSCLQIYLLAGQSNMAGRGRMETADHEPVPGIFVFDSSGHWQPASHPLHDDKPQIAGVGMGIDFAKRLRETDSTIAVGLVPCAVGGTSLKEWQLGGELFSRAMERVSSARKQGVLRGILWHQGESDATLELAPDYAYRLAKTIADFRGQLGLPRLPFVLGELGRFRCGRGDQSETIIAQQSLVPKICPNTACVSSESLNHVGDFSHFDAAAQRELGRRYADALLQLLANQRFTAEQVESLRPLNTRIYHDGWIDFNKNTTRDPYEDSVQPIEKRVEDLLKQMSLEEKTCQLATLYGYQRVLKDDLPTAEWKTKIWKDGIANIDEHLNGIPEWRSLSPSEYTSPPLYNSMFLGIVIARDFLVNWGWRVPVTEESKRWPSVVRYRWRTVGRRC